MISATQILSFLEDFIRIRGKKVDVIENPRHWRDVTSDLKHELRKLTRAEKSQGLRFFLL